MIEVINSDNNLTVKDMKEVCNSMWSDDKIVIVHNGEYYNVSSVKVDRDNGYVYLNV